MRNPSFTNGRVNESGDSLHSEAPVDGSHPAINFVSRAPRGRSNRFDGLTVGQADKDFLTKWAKARPPWVVFVRACINKVISHKRKNIPVRQTA